MSGFNENLLVPNYQHQQWIGGAETPGRPVWPLNDAFTSKKRLEGWACDTWGYCTHVHAPLTAFFALSWFFTSRKKWRPPRTTSFNTCQASRVLSKTTSRALLHQHFNNTPPSLTSYCPALHLNTSQINPPPNFPLSRAKGSVTFTRTALTPARPSLAATGCWEWSRSIIAMWLTCDWLIDPMVFVLLSPFLLLD